MSTYPRRSPRFQQQAQNTQSFSNSLASSRPSISQSSSASSTSHPSPTSDNLSLSTQSQYLVPPAQFDAPLPSPSVNEINPFAGYQYNYYNMGNQTQEQVQNQNNTATQNNQNQSQQSAFTQHHNSFSQPQRPNYPPTSVNGIPPGLPADFLAEAAKRAQMACLMRDLGDVEL